jgi:hypothetical protein
MTDMRSWARRYKALYEQQLEENKKLNEYLKTAEDNLDQEMLKNEKLLKRLTNNTRLIRKLKKDFDCLEAETTFENQKLIAEIKQLKPVSKDTVKEYDYVFESQRKEIIELKEEIKDRDNPDHPQYHEMCGYCDEVELGINEHIFIFEHETKETITTCCECGENKSVCKELKEEGYTRDQETEEEEEEQVKEEDICIHCDRKKKGPGDMFIIHQDLNCPKEEWCGECYMKVERYKLRSYP